MFGSPSEGFSQKNIKFPKFHIGEFETVPECFRCFQKRQHQNTRVSIIILWLCLPIFTICWYLLTLRRSTSVTIVNSGNYNIALVIHFPLEATLLNGSVEIFSRINECILQSNNIILFFLVTYRVQLHVLTMVLSIQRK